MPNRIAEKVFIGLAILFVCAWPHRDVFFSQNYYATVDQHGPMIMRYVIMRDFEGIENPTRADHYGITRRLNPWGRYFWLWPVVWVVAVATHWRWRR
jgi:hypothetical protein